MMADFLLVNSVLQLNSFLQLFVPVVDQVKQLNSVDCNILNSIFHVIEKTKMFLKLCFS
jgi:hypothetical protein